MRALALLTLIAGLGVLVRAPAGGPGAGPDAAGVQRPAVSDAALLRAAGGHLWFVRGGCRASRFAMTTAELVSAPGRYCQIWPSPDGRTVLAPDSTGPPPGPPGRLAVLSGATLRQRALTPLRGDQILPPVLWSPDGRLALACISERASRTTVELLERPWATVMALAQRCTPTFTGEALLTSAGGAVYENGGRLHLDAALAHGLGGRATAVTALASTANVLAAAVTAGAGRSALQVIDRASGGVRTIATPLPAAQVGISTDGAELWYRLPRAAASVLVQLRPEPRLSAVPHVASAYAWSPGGRYLAVAAGRSIRVFDRRDGRVAAVASGPVDSLAWTL